MPNYLLEIGTEELPADQVPEAQEKLKNLFREALTEARLSFGELRALGTPRRISCIVNGLAAMQETVKKKVKGPPAKSGFDAKGEPLPSALGFAQKQGISVSELGREEINGVEYIVADLTIKGRPVAQVLPEIVPGIIGQLSGERLMRWGDSTLRFSRPIRWMVSLLDDQEVVISLEGIKSGRESFGNRVLAPEKLRIDNPDTYVDALRKARVLVCADERESLIKQQVASAAEKLKGKARQLDGPLLKEVVNILEWPHPVVGEFAAEYLDLPDTLIETVMVHHQRYFPVERTDGGGTDNNKLLPYFITVANNDRREAEPHIKLGNERVLKARLADGRFFYFDDQKQKLSQRKESLGQLTYQEGLGSYLKKTERLLKGAAALSADLKLDSKTSICLERALELCKLDLVTSLVRELPELQGYVGAWYASLEGEPKEVVDAIVSHYQPRYQNDSIAGDLVGKFAAVIDKVDSLTGLFALGRRPSGSSDPYALRRQAQGAVDTLMDGLADYAIDLRKLISLFLDEVEGLLKNKKGFDKAAAGADLEDFFLQRVRAELQDSFLKREVIEAVTGSKDCLANLPLIKTRAKALQNLLSTEKGIALARAGVRVANILKGAKTAEGKVLPELLEIEAERLLYDALNKELLELEKNGKLKEPAETDADFEALLSQLVLLIEVIDKFFQDVMVNDPDPKKRDNRHALLGSINTYFAKLGDFTKLQPLLP